MKGFSQKYEYQQAQENAISAAIHVAAIVRVISFNPAKMTVNVQPVTQLNGSTGSQILGVPVAGTRGGGFIFRPVFRTGDIGVVLYLDHDMDEAMARGGDAVPNTERRHSDNDAVFLGGVISGGWSSSGLPEGIVLATEDGGIHLAVTSSGIKVKGTITVDGDVIADGISLKSHLHADVTTGGDVTGTPI